VGLQTEPGILMGTVGYMSPEQVKGQARIIGSDLFPARRNSLRDAGGEAGIRRRHYSRGDERDFEGRSA